jgi:hypothetical protein
MAAGRFQAFFGDDWDDAFDSIKSAPGAIGNLVVGCARQLRLVDGIAFALVVAGWLWLTFGYAVGGDHRVGLLVLALLPTLLWLAAGITGALIFEVGGIGVRILGYWEAYVLLLLFTLFGVASLRIALSPKDRRVYRGTPRPSDL